MFHIFTLNINHITNQKRQLCMPNMQLCKSQIFSICTEMVLQCNANSSLETKQTVPYLKRYEMQSRAIMHVGKVDLTSYKVEMDNYDNECGNISHPFLFII